MPAADAGSHEKKYDLVALAAPKLVSPLIFVVSYLLANRSLVGRLYASLLARKNGFLRLATQDSLQLLSLGFTPAAGRAITHPVTIVKDYPPAPKASSSSSSSPSSKPQQLGPVTCADYHHAYRSRTTSPMQVCDWLLDNLEKTNKQLNAVIRFDPSSIREQFAASEARYQKNAPLSPIDGVPFVVKDELHAAGYLGACGTNALEKSATPASKDCGVVANLKAAGAILIGKSHMTELGMAMNGYNPVNRQCVNPYDTRREPAGSSSGSGAAVAAGLCPFAIGCDGGGSIRMPAARCAAVGLKPTKGLVTNEGRVIETTTTLGHVGPIAATAQDALLMLHYMTSRRDVGDIPRSLAMPNITNLKIGIYWPWFRDVNDSRIKSICEESVNKLKQLGADIVDIEIPHLNRAGRAHSAIILHECRGAMTKLMGEQKWDNAVMEDLGYEVRMKILVSETIDKLTTDDERKQPLVDTAFACREEIFKCFASLLEEKCDVIATPTMPTLPPFHANGGPKLDVTEDSCSMRFMLPANITGLPAVTVNVGWIEDGSHHLPVGLQFMGNCSHERRLLQLAHLFESPEGVGVSWKRPDVYVSPPFAS
ncbi:amidase [Pycnococcus provasolii]